MDLGVILPCTKLFGGVKRFLELGNILMRLGHTFTVFTPDGVRPDWFDFAGNVEPLEAAAGRELDVLFVTETQYVPALCASRARIKAFYVVSKNRDLRAIAAHTEIVFFANSATTMKHAARMTRRRPVPAIGGVNLENFGGRCRPQQERPFVVMVFGRLSRKHKGTEIVVRACEKLRRRGLDLRLLLFDTPVDERSKQLIDEFGTTVPFEYAVGHPPERNVELFNRAHMFVSAERKGGWANTAAEAMAAGVPVAATKVGTEDFLLHEQTGLMVRRSVGSIASAIRRIYFDETLGRALGQAGQRSIERFTWERCATQILEYLEQA